MLVLATAFDAVSGSMLKLNHPHTDSWCTGANIPGKPRQFLSHVRGSKYFDRVTEIAERRRAQLAKDPSRR